jgi:hypothetical protein
MRLARVCPDRSLSIAPAVFSSISDSIGIGKCSFGPESPEKRREFLNRLEVQKGDFILILPNEKHQYRNKSPHDPMIMICAVPKEYE